MSRRLGELFDAAAARYGERIAIEDPALDGAVTYAQLRDLSHRVGARLAAQGVGPGDRVGVSGKSIGTLAAMFGALEIGAAYVPVDATAPVRRGASIHADCGVEAIVAEPAFAAELAAQRDDAPAATPIPELAPHGAQVLLPGPDAGTTNAVDGLAYILYTSGSTGKPKGVTHTHASALAFVDWCTREFQPTPEDRFSSHAPFHFDLSILDVFVPLLSGSTLVLFGEEIGKQPAALAALIAERRISVWYSTPSILTLLLEFGRLERHSFDALRLVLFAGEVFPIGNLRRLKEVWPAPRYANLYGPTETNVCTWFEAPREIPDQRTDPLPIGRACSDDRLRVVDAAGHDVAPGAEGELLVAGGSVMQGYWNDPERTSAAFLEDGGERWYATGDVVRADDDQDLLFLGRRDRMIKRRGYRIEPGEIESALHRSPDVIEAAVLGLTGGDGSSTIVACLVTRDGEPLSVVALKRFCAENLPLYMVPDRFTFHAALPKTSTDKVDYRTLTERI
jgi:amino acid adenylation domain-containing protein